MGAAIGREAALKDMAATVAGKVSDWSRLSPEQRHLLVACGAGAGMAAAYNVSMGGALFTAEVLLGTLSLSSVVAALATSFVAVAVSWLLLPNIPTFNVAALSFSPSLLLWAAIAGPILGLASAFYVKIIRWAGTGKPKGWLAIAAPIVVFTALGLVATKYPEILAMARMSFRRPLAVSLARVCWYGSSSSDRSPRLSA